MYATHRFAPLLAVLIVPVCVLAQGISDTSVSQATGRPFGFSVSYGDGVNTGLRARVTPSLVLRPSVGITNSKSRFNLPGFDESSSLIFKLALDLLFANSVDESVHQFQPYYGMGISFDYNEFRPAYPGVRRQLSYRGLVGGTYWMSDRFSFWGEVGLSIGDDPKLDGSYYQLTTVSRLGLNLIF